MDEIVYYPSLQAKNVPRNLHIYWLCRRWKKGLPGVNDAYMQFVNFFSIPIYLRNYLRCFLFFMRARLGNVYFLKYKTGLQQQKISSSNNT